MEKYKAQDIYSNSEIMSRFIMLTESFTGPTLYPVQIGYSADNATEPPVIRCEVFRWTGDVHHPTEHLFDAVVDQNTTLEEFEKMTAKLNIVAKRILESMSTDVPIEEIIDRGEAVSIPDLPF